LFFLGHGFPPWPWTSPYSFQGLGEEGLKILDLARKRKGIPVFMEVMDSMEVPYHDDIVNGGIME